MPATVVRARHPRTSTALTAVAVLAVVALVWIAAYWASYAYRQSFEPPTKTILGRVLDDKGQPVAGAEVTGYYTSIEAKRWIHAMKTGADGRFRFERCLHPMVLHARSADGLRAGVARSGVQDAALDIVAGPVGSATGRLLDLKGDPIAKKPLQYGIRIHMDEPENRLSMPLFGGKATTDDQGRFELVGLVSGETYSLEFLGDDAIYRNLKTFEPKGVVPIDLGDLRVDPKPRPGAPPTPEERANKAFAAEPTATPSERKDTALKDSSREHTRPLLLFSQPKDPACIELFRLLAEEPDEAADKAKRPTPQQLRWEFELASFDSEQPEVRKLAEALGVDVDKGRPPVLAVLEADGSLTATHALALGPQQKLDGDVLASFLARHKPPARDAEAMLADAFKKAKADDKRVFFVASASWCRPCRALGRFLDAWKGELERHFVFVKLDVSRDEHAAAVMARIRGDEHPGVPWSAILDGDGKALATTYAPDPEHPDKVTYLGYPSEPADVALFMKMLTLTAPRLSDRTRTDMQQALLNKK